MKRMLSLILSVILILSVCVIPQIGFAAEGFTKTFSTADDAQSLSDWTLPEGYVLSDADGLTHASTMQKVYYNGGNFSGKYEYSVDFKSVYENSVRIITNYIDKGNFYYMEINPKKSTVSLKTFRRGSIATHGSYSLPFEIKATNVVTARVVSNGGEGMSMYLKLDGGEESVIFENVHVKDYIDEGTVGFDAQANPLKVNNFKVTVLGEKDFVPPVEEEKPDEGSDVETNTPDSEQPVDKNYDDKALKVVTALGIMDKTALENGRAQVTAEEFAQVINVLKSEYASNDEKITLGTAVEAMVKILGYDVMVGSKNSYYRQADSLKLLDGIDAKTTDNLIKYDFAQMIYNALDVEILQFVSYGDKVSYSTRKNQTLLTKTLEMGMVEGQVTDNGVTGKDGPSAVGQYHMVINGLKLFSHRDNLNRNDYIGRCVTAYYDNSDPDRKELIYIDYHEKEEVLVITPETYLGYSSASKALSYLNGSKVKTAKIDTRKIIYNGYYRTDFSKTLFDNITHGSITLVSSTGSRAYDTVIVRDYKSVYVNGIDTVNFKIFNKSYDGDPGEVETKDFEFLADDNLGKSYVYITDTEGNRMDFSEIQVGDVLSIAEANKDDGIAEIIVSRKTVADFEINEIYTDETNIQTISDFTTQYKVNKEYKKAFDGGEFEPGDVALLYLDAFGYVSWAELSGSQEIYVGVLADSGMTQGIDAQLQIAVFETDGEQQILTAARKIRFTDEAGVKETLSASDVADKISGLNEFIAYTIDDNDFVTSIELPLAEANKEKDNYLTTLYSGDTLPYQYYSKSFGYEYFLSSSPRFISVEEAEKTDLTKYSITSITSEHQHAKLSEVYGTMKAYSIDGNNIVDYVLLYGSETQTLNVEQREVVVTSVSRVFDEETGTKLVKIQGFNGSGITLYAEPNVASSAASMATRNSDEPKRYSVKKGDIIKYKLDNITGWVEEFVIVFRSEGGYPYTGEAPYDVRVQSEGWILDGVLKPPSDDILNGNPIKIDSSFNLVKPSLIDSNSTTRNADDTRRIFYGWVYDKYDGIMEVTTQDLSTGATYFNIGREYGYNTTLHENYVNQFYRISAYGTKVKVVYSNTGKEKTITASSGSASDIKSYKEVGRNCSRVILATSGNDDVWYMIILNNE